MIKVYSTETCSACNSAKAWLKDNNIEFESVMIDEDIDAAKLMMSRGLRTVPQIYIGEEHIGGWEDLRQLGLQGVQAKIGGA